MYVNNMCDTLRRKSENLVGEKKFMQCRKWKNVNDGNKNRKVLIWKNEKSRWFSKCKSPFAYAMLYTEEYVQNTIKVKQMSFKFNKITFMYGIWHLPTEKHGDSQLIRSGKKRL